MGLHRQEEQSPSEDAIHSKVNLFSFIGQSMVEINLQFETEWDKQSLGSAVEKLPFCKASTLSPPQIHFSRKNSVSSAIRHLESHGMLTEL